MADKSSFRNTQVWGPKSLDARAVPGGERGVGGGGERGRCSVAVGDHENCFHHHEMEDQGPPRRSGSWGNIYDIRGVKPKGRTEVERARR